MFPRCLILIGAALLAGPISILPAGCDQGTSPATSSSANESSSPTTTPPPPLPDEYPNIDPLVLEAIDAAHRRVSSSPDDPSAWADLGIVYHANRHYSLADTCYRQALQLDPGRAMTWFHLAEVQVEQSDMSLGAEIMQNAIALEPGFAPAHWRLGLMMFDQGRIDEAETAFRAATEADAFDAAGWFGLARIALERGDHETLKQIVETRLIHGPHERYARSLLARSLQMQGRTDEAAIESARGRGAELPWQDPWTRQVNARRTGLLSQRSTAAVLDARGRHSEAVQIYNRLHARWPDDPEVTNGLALALAHSGNIPQAVQLLNDYRSRFPAHYETVTNLAAVHLMQSRTPADVDAVIEILDESVALQPAFAYTHEIRAAAFFKKRDFDSAVDAYRNAFEFDARKHGLLVEIGRCRVGQRRWLDAEQAFEESIAHDPASGDAWLGLGIARMEQGNLDGAEDALTSARDLMKPDDPAYGVLVQRMQALQQKQRGRP